MDQQHLRELLEQLHAELAHGPPLDEESRRHLLDVQADIARAVAPSSSDQPLPPGEHEELQGRLQEAVVGFEGSHPKLASTLERMMAVLSNMGL